MIGKQKRSACTCLLHHATTKTGSPLLYVVERVRPARSQPYLERATLKTTKASETSKCSAALPGPLNDSVSVTARQKQPLPLLPFPAHRGTHSPEQIHKERRSDKGNLIRAKPSLKLPPAACSALAEWTWFNPCISCHGFPFFPTIMT